MSKFLGVDPGLNFTGWSIVEYKGADKFAYIASGVIKTSAKDKHPKRLNKIFNCAIEIINLYAPNYAAIEDTYVNINNKSSLVLAQAKAASIIAIAQKEIDIIEYPAKKIKKTITGSGTADKLQMMKMIEYWLPDLSIKSSDEADAIAIAICHASHYKHVST